MSVIKWKPTLESLQKSKDLIIELMNNPWCDATMIKSLREKLKRVNQELDKIKP